MQLEHDHNGKKIRWFALVGNYNNMQVEVYQHIDENKVEALYLLTPMAQLLNQSPLVISLKATDSIIDKLPKENTLYFSVPDDVPFAEVMTHLRSRLNVQYFGNRKGLMHYYVPSVASYFFTFSDVSDTAHWLGLFTSVYYYRQVKSLPPQWIKMTGIGNQSDDSSWILTPSQVYALNEKSKEQGIADWADKNNISSINWDQQKQVSSFCEQHEINAVELITKVRHLVHSHSIDMDKIYLPLDGTKTSPQAIVNMVEASISKGEQYV